MNSWSRVRTKEHTVGRTTAKRSDQTTQTPPLPDYSARRRRIFGDKVLPNMVLSARAQEPW